MDRWATFDCYGTLIDWERGLRTVLGSLFPDRDPDELLAAHHRIEPTIQAGSVLPYREVLARAARESADELGLPLAPDAETAVPDSLPTWPPFPEVAAALRALREDGWRLAILSNTDPDLLAASIAAIGVEIDERITVAEAGSYKPARGHWEAFFARTDAERDGHVHVAASLFHDVEPCAALGLRCVWINRLAEVSDLPRTVDLPDLTVLPATLASFFGR